MGTISYFWHRAGFEPAIFHLSVCHAKCYLSHQFRHLCQTLSYAQGTPPFLASLEPEVAGLVAPGATPPSKAL